MKAILICILLTFACPAWACAGFTDDDWHVFGGVPDTGWTKIHAMTTDDSGRLYVGGDFNSMGGVPANKVAMWDGTSWHALGTGITTSSHVTSLATDGTNIFAGYTGGGISRWNGASWSLLDISENTGPAGSIEVICIHGSVVYAAGTMALDGEDTRIRLARWTGATGWTIIGDPLWESIEAICVAGNDLYVGGSFTSMNGVSANRIAKWNGTTWSPLGEGVDGDVMSLAWHQGALYVGGDFDHAGGVAASNIARWDGQTWSALGTGISAGPYPARVYALAASDGSLFAGGTFTQAGGAATSRIARWNGVEWSSMGSGVSSTVEAMSVFGSSLYVGGSFPLAGGHEANGIARADLSAFLPSPYEAVTTAAGLSGTDSLPSAIPFHDGVPNLLKYAFNMNLAGRDFRTMVPGGTAGLPHVSRMSGESPVLRIEHLRRIDGGVNYLPQTGSTLNDWQPVTVTPQVTPVDASWERVVYEVPATPDRMFGRVGVELVE